MSTRCTHWLVTRAQPHRLLFLWGAHRSPVEFSGVRRVAFAVRSMCSMRSLRSMCSMRSLCPLRSMAPMYTLLWCIGLLCCLIPSPPLQCPARSMGPTCPQLRCTLRHVALALQKEEQCAFAEMEEQCAFEIALLWHVEAHRRSAMYPTQKHSVVLVTRAVASDCPVILLLSEVVLRTLQCLV